MTTTIKSEMIRPNNVLFAITQDTENVWPFAFEIDGEEVERFKTQSEAETAWNRELSEYQECGAAN